MTSRRTFLRQTALTAGGLLLTQNTLGNLFQARKPKVVIIGAGLAGLSAAFHLKKRNIDFVILESRERIGGRVFSHKINEDLVIELGGEWVGNSHTRIHELCDEMKLELFNNQMDTHLIYKGQYRPAGQWDYSPDWQNKFKKIIADYSQFTDADKLALDQMDWWRYLVNNGCAERDLDIRELLDSTDFGESIRHVSAFAALAEYAESSEKNEMDKKIKGGNGKLAEKLAEKAGKEQILLNHRVNKIVQDGKVRVHCDNGKIVEGDKIICTLPTFALKKIDWQPGFPAEKTDAINELQYARINKHAMHFSKRFWKEESFDMITDQSPHYFYHATKNQPSASGVLISYTIGEKAAVVANQGNEWNREAVMQTIEPVFGNVRPLLQQQLNYYWGNDDYSKGSYAIYGINQWFRIRPVLQAAHLHTLFAGEHLADWQGFMEGAINTGEAAAEQI